MISKLQQVLNESKVEFKVERVEGQENLVGVYIAANGVMLAAVGVDVKDMPELLKALQQGK